MMGRTHVMSAAAALQTGLLAFTVFQSQSFAASWPDRLPFFDMPLSFSISGFTYTLMILCVVPVLLLLLGVGRRKMSVLYLPVSAVAGVLLHIQGETAALTLSLVFVCFLLGSLLPDIDADESILGRYVPFISRAIPHRTITHTLWFVLIFASAAWFLHSILFAALTLGVVFHIVEDTFSRQGICWFYPLIGSYVTLSGGAVLKNGRHPNVYYTTEGVFDHSLFWVSAAGFTLGLLWIGYGFFPVV